MDNSLSFHQELFDETSCVDYLFDETSSDYKQSKEPHHQYFYKAIKDSIENEDNEDIDISYSFNSVLDSVSRESFLDGENTSIGQSKLQKYSRTKELIDSIIKKETKYICDSYYIPQKEFSGVVDALNWQEGKFSALMTETNTKEQISVEFNIDDFQWKSDIELLQIGSQIVWLLGQDVNIIKSKTCGHSEQITNSYRLFIRRMATLNKRRMEKAEENASYWTKFFRECDTEDSSEE